MLAGNGDFPSNKENTHLKNLIMKEKESFSQLSFWSTFIVQQKAWKTFLISGVP